MNAARISRSHVPSLRCAGACRRGCPHRRGGFRRLAHRRPGARRLITPADLPAPLCDEVGGGNCHNAKRARQPKFQRRRRASRSNFSRAASKCRAIIRIAPNGDIFVAETGAGRVRVFHPAKAGGGPAQGEVFAEGVQRVLWDRVLSFRAEPAICLCRDAGLGRPLSLSQRRDEGLAARPSASRPCQAAADTGRATSPSRRRQNAVRFGRLRQQCRRGRAARGPDANRRSAARRLVRR